MLVLALFLTELFQKIHEDNRLRHVVRELREELISNRKAEEIQFRYHLQVLKNIESALADPIAKTRKSSDHAHSDQRELSRMGGRPRT
jgi:hypothetical protein